MTKKKSLLLILLLTWIVFCFVWFFAIYKKDQQKTLAVTKQQNQTPLQTTVTEDVLIDSNINSKDSSVTEIIAVQPDVVADSNSLSTNTTAPIVTPKAMDEVISSDTVGLQAIPVTENDANAIRKIEGAVNKKLSVCYFYNNSDKKLRNFSPRISKKIQSYLATANSKIIITGHTDYVGSTDYNYKLGLQRAERVKQILIKKGIAAADIQVVSMGEEKPVANNKSLKGRARNRRVEINITLS
jgi:outer membrane protein OmpA-like peptidoglycan-associated protein